MQLLVLTLLYAVSSLAIPHAQAPGGLKVIVIDGDEAANIVEERIAAEPVIEVRDRDDRRVVGAVVRFLIRRTALGNRIPAVFGNGQSEVRTLTDATGRAGTSALTPLEPGRFEIDVQVSHQGQNATATIRHTNFSTATQARAAGREPGQSSSSTTTSPAAAGTTGAAGAAGAAAAGAGTAGTAAVGGGGGIGLGKLALIGLTVGGAGAGAAVALSRKDSDPGARVTAVTASTRNGILATTAFTFSVEAVDFDAGALTYAWEFGDGATATTATATHVYLSAGTYTVVVTVGDGRQSARSETSVIVFSLTGTWVGTSPTLAGTYTLELSQSGTAITGRSSLPGSLPGQPEVFGAQFSNCALSGTTRNGSPAVVLNQPVCPNPEANTFLVPVSYQLDLSSDGQTLSGVLGAGVRQVTLRRS